MNTTATVQAHKAVTGQETQRRHVRIRLSAAVKVRKDIFDLHNLSVGGFSVISKKVALPAVKAEEMTLFFPFESFALHLKVKAAPVYRNAEAGIFGFRFVNLTKRQVAFLSHVVSACAGGPIAGRINAGNPLKWN